jgi:hypothetical protein
VIPNNLKNIGKLAFSGTTNLKSIKLNNGLQSIGRGAFSCSGLTEISIPGSVSAGAGTRDAVFGGCESLKKAEFEEGFEGLAIDFFMDCTRLTDVIFPTSLKTFTRTFSGCLNLTNVYMKSMTPPAEGLSKSEIKKYFSDSYNVTIWVPMSAVETYKNDDVWGYWADRIKGYDFD